MSKESEILQEYREKIDDLVEVDYGDFKRKLGQYIIRIEEDLKPLGKAEVNRSIADFRKKVLYETNADIEACRDLALQKVDHLLEVVGD